MAGGVDGFGQLETRHGIPWASASRTFCARCLPSRGSRQVEVPGARVLRLPSQAAGQRRSLQGALGPGGALAGKEAQEAAQPGVSPEDAVASRLLRLLQRLLLQAAGTPMPQAGTKRGSEELTKLGELVCEPGLLEAEVTPGLPLPGLAPAPPPTLSWHLPLAQLARQLPIPLLALPFHLASQSFSLAPPPPPSPWGRLLSRLLEHITHIWGTQAGWAGAF